MEEDDFIFLSLWFIVVEVGKVFFVSSLSVKLSKGDFFWFVIFGEVRFLDKELYVVYTFIFSSFLLVESRSSNWNRISYSGDILLEKSIYNVLVRKSVDLWLIFEGSNFLMGIVLMLLPSSFYVLAFQGVFPVNIS